LQVAGLATRSQQDIQEARFIPGNPPQVLDFEKLVAL